MTINRCEENEVTGVNVKVEVPPELDLIAMVLDSCGALEGVRVSYEKDWYYAAFAWPKKRIALMVDEPLSERDCPYDVRDELTYREARDEFFAERGWVVLHVNPCGLGVEKKAARIALIVRSARQHRKLAS